MTAGLTAAVGLNGAPLIYEPAGLTVGGARPANPWLKPRGNVLNVSLARPPATNPPPPAARFRAEVYSVQPGSATNERDTTLVKFEWKAGDPAPLPVNRELPFEVTAPPPCKLWAEAAMLNEITTADKQAMRAIIQKHADAIDRRDLDDLSALLEYKNTDCALANGQDPEEMRRVTRELYTKEMFTERSLTVDGGSAKELQFKIIAGGQVVWLYQSLSKPALVVESPQKQFTLPVFTAKIAGAWRIVR
jgi:hypothetical protein